MKFLLVRYLLFIMLTIYLIGCSPVPMIQSPRVKSAVSIGAYSISGSKIDDELIPCYLKLGFLNRIEIGGFIMPPLLNNYGASGNLKVFVFKCGKPLLLKNIATAMIAGGNYSSGEWDESKSEYAGTIFSTRHIFKSGEFELIFQPAYYKDRIIHKPDGGPTEYEKTDGLHLNFGCINTFDCNPDNRFSFDLLIAGGYKSTINYKKKNVQSIEIQTVKTSHEYYNNWVWQFGLAFNWKPRHNSLSTAISY